VGSYKLGEECLDFIKGKEFVD